MLRSSINSEHHRDSSTRVVIKVMIRFSNSELNKILLDFHNDLTDVSKTLQ